MPKSGVRRNIVICLRAANEVEDKDHREGLYYNIENCTTVIRELCAERAQILRREEVLTQGSVEQ